MVEQAEDHEEAADDQGHEQHLEALAEERDQQHVAALAGRERRGVEVVLVGLDQVVAGVPATASRSSSTLAKVASRSSSRGQPGEQEA